MNASAKSQKPTFADLAASLVEQERQPVGMARFAKLGPTIEFCRSKGKTHSDILTLIQETEWPELQLPYYFKLLKAYRKKCLGPIKNVEAAADGLVIRDKGAAKCLAPDALDDDADHEGDPVFLTVLAPTNLAKTIVKAIVEAGGEVIEDNSSKKHDAVMA